MIAAPEVTSPRRSEPIRRRDAIVVGAGPYGLSTAAHLRGRGLDVAVFGKTLELWREHMPKGMKLRSHWWASNLSDPAGRHGFEQFFRATGHAPSEYAKRYPTPIQAFLDYGQWFQERVVPDVDETYVSSIRQDGDDFLLTLADGRQVRSASVVMAIGLGYYANRPRAYDGLPAGLVSHSSEHKDFSRFKDREVVVVGGGQSAVEYSALLYEAGARVHLVARRPVDWLGRDRTWERSRLERIMSPTAGIADGWVNWTLEHQPYLFYRFPSWIKDHRMRPYYLATASHWLKARVIGKAILHEGRGIVGAEPAGAGVNVRLSDGQTISADHIVLATGYKVDVSKLGMLHPSLLTAIRPEEPIEDVATAGAGAPPVLDAWFQSTVPGLFFVGVSSMRAFGPLYRFVLGCGAAAQRVAGAVARRTAGQKVGAAR
jgi:FAD-dependent urate hydroxylase